MKAQPPVTARQSAKPQPIVESADLLGLAEIHFTGPSQDQFVKRSETSDKSSSSLSAHVLRIPPSLPSISTALAIGAPRTEPPASSRLSSPSQNARSVIETQETPQDHARRINQEISNNEKKLSEMKAIGYVPPHLRPPPRASADGSEDAYGNYIPPHLRRPKGVGGKTNTEWGGSGRGPVANGPYKVSVVLTPISQIAGKQTADIAPLIKVAQPATMVMSSSRRELTPVQVKQSTRIQQGAATAPSYLSVQDPFRTIPENTATDKPGSLGGKAVNSPPPPIGGTKIKTAYFPLRPETPPSARRNGDVSFHDHRDSYSSRGRNSSSAFYGRRDSRSSISRSKFIQDDGEGDFLILDHERSRKLRSYTHYRSKSGFAPHNPRLPFEFLHKIYGPGGATYAETLGERLDSSSVLGPRSLPIPGKTYGRPSMSRGSIIQSNQESSYRIPEHMHIRGYGGTMALGSGSETPTVETDGVIFKTWPQPPNRSADERHQKSRSVILSGFTKMPTWEQISRVCKETGKVEDMEISNKHGMAMVTFVEASTAQHFYETTDARGILLVYVDEETNETVRARIYIDMNPEIVVIGDRIRQLVDTEGASRVLEIVGWTRDILECMVGGLHEGGIGYSDLLMRLASLYCPSHRIQCVDWRQNEAGHMEVRFVYAGITDAVRARAELGKESALKICRVMFGSDP